MTRLRRATLSLAIASLAPVAATGPIVLLAAPAAAPAASTAKAPKAKAPKATTGTTTPTPGAAAGTTTTPAATSTAATTTAPAATLSATTITIHHTSGDHTAAVLLLVAVGGLLALAALIWAAVTWSAEEPEWLLRARHATGEAGWRIGNTWAEFVDFLRLGR
jgi:hypothetical protein